MVVEHPCLLPNTLSVLLFEAFELIFLVLSYSSGKSFRERLSKMQSKESKVKSLMRLAEATSRPI